MLSINLSSNTESALALFEKQAQLRQIIFAGLQRDRVDVVPAQHPRELLLTLISKIAETRARCAIGRIDFNLIASLGFFQGDDPDIWQCPFSFVVNMDRHEIVPPAAHRQGSRKIRRLKI